MSCFQESCFLFLARPPVRVVPADLPQLRRQRDHSAVVDLRLCARGPIAPTFDRQARHAAFLRRRRRHRDFMDWLDSSSAATSCSSSELGQSADDEEGRNQLPVDDAGIVDLVIVWIGWTAAVPPPVPVTG